MGVPGAVVSQCFCGKCGKWSEPEAVAAAGGTCPYCSQPMEDDGIADPVYLVGGKSHIGYGNLAELDRKRREAERRAAEALGEGGSSGSSLFDEPSSSTPKRRVYGGDPEVPMEKPDFAPEPTDQAVIDEIEEAEASKLAMDVWELEDEELDEFGNPIVPGGGGASGDAGRDDDIPLGENPFAGMDDEFDGVPDFDDGPPDFEDAPDFADEIPNSGGDYEEDGFEDDELDEDGVSLQAFDPAGSGMPQEVPEPTVETLDDEGPWDRQPGVPSPRELAVLSAPLPAIAAKGFDRGPRPDFRTGPEPVREGFVRIDDMELPRHPGTIRRLDAVHVAYRNDFGTAKKFR